MVNKVGCVASSGEERNHKIKVIIDFGSGTTKFKKVSFVHTENRWKVDKAISIPIPHQRCLEESSVPLELPQNCIDEGLLQIAKGLDFLDADCNEVECTGLATAWARSAKNQHIYFNAIKQKYQMSIVTLTHYQEGVFGYISSLHFLQERNPGYDLSKIIIWDIGGGSFQQVAVTSVEQNVTDCWSILNDKRALHANLAPWGSVNFAHNLYQHLEVTNTSRLLKGAEVDRAGIFAQGLFSSLNSTSIAELIKDEDRAVYAIGEFMNKGFLPFNGRSQKFTLDWAYTLRFMFKEQNEEGLCKLLQQLSPEYDCRNLKIIETNLFLVIAIMEGLGLTSFSFLPEASVVGAVDCIDRLVSNLYENDNSHG